MKKRIVSLLAGVMVVTMVAGCGGSTASSASAASSAGESVTGSASVGQSTAEEVNREAASASSAEEEEKEKDYLDIADIAWNVDEGIVDGERYVLLSIENNSPYALAGFEITFSEKDSVTDEEKEKYYAEVTELLELSEDDVKQLKEMPIGASVETDMLVLPGEKAENINLHYYTGYYYLKNIEHFGYVEPDIATISYVKDEKIYTEYYDFHSDKYSKETETETAVYWSKTPLGELIPKPDSPIIKEDGRDDEDCFMFEAFGFSMDKFNEYISQCKELGFTVDSDEYEGFYSADNEAGYNIYATYDEKSRSLGVILDAPEEPEEETETAEASEAAEETEEAAGNEADTETETAASGEVSAEVKEFVDSYEAFMTEYVDFMKRFNDAKDSAAMLDEYTDFANRYTEFLTEASDYETDDELTTADYEYLLDAENRINKKLLEIYE